MSGTGTCIALMVRDSRNPAGRRGAASAATARPPVIDARAAQTTVIDQEAGVFVSAGIIVAIVAVVVIGAVAWAMMAVIRRRRLQQRFGPEYDRLAGERGSRREAEAELAGREHRVRDLGIQPLTGPARASYADQWMVIQERFVDTPAEAVSGAQLLVAAVMTERGYPAGGDDQVLADLSVEYSGALGRYRAAEEISHRAAAGAASTEDLRQAMTGYRALFGDLLGEPADTGPGSPGAAADTTTGQRTGSDPKEMAT
jgi:hypothetical protein